MRNNNLVSLAFDYLSYLDRVKDEVGPVKRIVGTKSYILGWNKPPKFILKYFLKYKFHSAKKDRTTYYHDNIDSINKFTDRYTLAKHHLLYPVDFTVWLNTVEDFCQFIMVSEKCFMYNNSANSPIYVEETESKKVINFQFKDYIAKITIEDTNISLGGSSLILDSNIKTIMTLYKIYIRRSFGNYTDNTFRFVTDEEPKFEDDSDKILFNVFIQDSSRLMLDTLDNILESIAPIYIGNDKINWKEAVENGLWIR